MRQSATFFERFERVEFVRNRMRDLLNDLDSDFAWPEEDGRIRFINNSLAVLRASAVHLHFSHVCLNNLPLGKQVLGLSDPARVEPNVKNAAKFTKLSCCLQLNFQIETVLRNLLQALGVPDPSGYYNVCKGMLSQVDISTGHPLKVMSLPAHIRNSQHSNGIHHGYRGTDTVTQLSGVRFAFRHGKMVQCASWDHILHANLGVLRIMRRIYYHPKVKCIPAPLPDQFV